MKILRIIFYLPAFISYALAIIMTCLMLGLARTERIVEALQIAMKKELKTLEDKEA